MRLLAVLYVVILVTLILIALATSGCTPPTAPSVPDWRIAKGNGAAPKDAVLPEPGTFVPVDDLKGRK